MSRIPAEILAPVGTWEMCLAAVHNGADAIYVGMPGFNARGRTETLSPETLSEIIRFCHLYNVKVFLAFNVLIFEQELPAVVELLREILPLSPDALIVQDIGLVRLIKALAPQQVVHASTQMTITCAEAIEGTRDLDMARYVLARELSLEEIRKIRSATDKELEVFVHGALCVSYSGQCLTSESLGGRSANRGQCAQSCRLPYDLMVDGVRLDLGEKRYLVSPKDLCSIEEVPALKDAGVDSFKIEGRLKSAEYVASTARAYHAALHGESGAPEIGDLKIIYSRDFFSGWMHGVNHQQLVRGDFSSHTGLELGRIDEIGGDHIIITANRTLQNGDGLLFLDRASEKRLGSPIYRVTPLSQGRLRLELDHSLDLNQLNTNMLVFLNSAPEFERGLRQSFNDRDHRKRLPIVARLSGTVGCPLLLTLVDGFGNTGVAESEELLQPAERSALSAERCMDEISALTNTPYRLEKLHCDLVGELFISNRTVRKLRQRAVKMLSEKRLQRPVPDFSPVEDLLRRTETDSAPDKVAPHLSLLLREESQLEALRELSPTTVYLDFEFGKLYEGAIERVRELGHRVGIATTRILKPQEKGHLKYIERLRPDTVLVRNLGALHYFTHSGMELIGDFSLNITNSLTANWFLEKGATILTPSYDLNHEQLLALLRNSAPGNFEITIHQYMPAFHMEHCVFAMALSNGTSWRDCGKPCEKHRVQLKGPQGALHPLKADAECRNTMFKGEAQSAARLVPDLISTGAHRFRFEALFESASELRAKIDAYRSFLSETSSLDQLFQSCRALDQYGVSEGQLLSIRTFKDRKKEGGFAQPLAVQELLADL